MTCPCNCGKPVKEGYRYAARGCWMRSPEGRKKASEIGRKGGRTERLNVQRAAAIARVAHLSREDAIWATVQWTRQVEQMRIYRKAERKAAA